jgi:hypothetical protein
MTIAFFGCGYAIDTYMRSRWAHNKLDTRIVFGIDTARWSVASEHRR